MPDGDVVQFRLSPANRPAFDAGIKCTEVRIAEGQDGIYEIELIGADPGSLPDHGNHPLVPIK